LKLYEGVCCLAATPPHIALGFFWESSCRFFASHGPSHASTTGPTKCPPVQQPLGLKHPYTRVVCPLGAREKGVPIPVVQGNGGVVVVFGGAREEAIGSVRCGSKGCSSVCLSVLEGPHSTQVPPGRLGHAWLLGVTESEVAASHRDDFIVSREPRLGPIPEFFRRSCFSCSEYFSALELRSCAPF